MTCGLRLAIIDLGEWQMDFLSMGSCNQRRSMIFFCLLLRNSVWYAISAKEERRRTYSVAALEVRGGIRPSERIQGLLLLWYLAVLFTGAKRLQQFSRRLVALNYTPENQRREPTNNDMLFILSSSLLSNVFLFVLSFWLSFSTFKVLTFPKHS